MLPILDVSMLRALVTIGAVLALAGGASAELLPRPEGLEPNVQFWKRIYTEVDGNGGLIHDTEELDVVYERVDFPEGLSQRARERRVERAKDRVRAALRVLGQGRRSGLSEDEARVLSRWPAGVSDQTLRAAAGRVRFQLGQADKFRAGLIRSGAWRDHIVEVLTGHGVPSELVALPHVESSYFPKSYSRVGAAGLWQFTRGTGRRYMRVDHVVDERMDPYRSTEAAARLLRDNYADTLSWPLAITGYNHGVAGMVRAARQLGTKDMAVIARRYKSRSFGFASRNFYSEFLAALEIDRDPERYFGPLTPDVPVAYELVELDHYYPVASLSAAFGLPLAVLREHNPGLRSPVWDGTKYAPRGFTLRVPQGRVGRPLEVALAEVPASQRFADQHRDKYYQVQRGDTISTIARRHHVSVSELVALNHLRSRHRIRVGQVLVLPGGGAAPLEVAAQEPPADGLYRVRRGDNLTTIAARFGLSATALARENGLHNRNQLRVGQTLRLPGVQVAAVEQTIQVAAVEQTIQVAAVEPTQGTAVEEPAAQPTATASQVVPAPGPSGVVSEVAPEPIRVVPEAAPAPAPTEVAAEEAPAPTEVVSEVAPEPIRVVPEAAPAPAPTGVAAEEAPAPEPIQVASIEEPARLPVAEAQPRTHPAPTRPVPAAGPEPAPRGITVVALAPAPSQQLAEAEPAPPEEPVAYVEVVADATEATTASEDGSLEPDPDLELDAPAQAAPREPGAPSPDPSNYAVTADRRIVIQAEETLGHYAEWLEVRASELRRLNRMSYKTPLVIGRTLRLDFSKVTPEVFEERRLEFHQAIQDDFFSSYVVSGTTQHTLRRGESVWYLAERKFRVPVWLLRQYNPDLDFGSLPVGASLVIPEIQPRPS